MGVVGNRKTKPVLQQLCHISIIRYGGRGRSCERIFFLRKCWGAPLVGLHRVCYCCFKKIVGRGWLWHRGQLQRPIYLLPTACNQPPTLSTFEPLIEISLPTTFSFPKINIQYTQDRVTTSKNEAQSSSDIKKMT